MVRIKQIIMLHESGKSYRDISNQLGLSRKTTTKYILLFKSTGLSWQEVKPLTDNDFNDLIFNQETPDANRLAVLENQFPTFRKELARVGVTKQLLWSEYKTEHPGGYNYTQFCHYYNLWNKTQTAVMHFEHKAGDKMFVDFAGKKFRFVNSLTGEIRNLEVFIAVNGASQFTYAEAIESQKQEDFLSAVANSLEYFGGVPAAIVPDNLKSAVTKADKYEAQINHYFDKFGLHYNSTILPARSRAPRDKALVEGAVKILYTRIYAALRDKAFASIQEVNQAFLELLEKHHDTKFQNRDYSRRDLFNSFDKPALRQLPAKRYEISNYKILSVIKNSYIWFSEDRHYYSVPYQYIGKKVKVEYTKSNISVYYNYERIAFHKRSYQQYKYTTVPQHLPSQHRFVNSWSPEFFINWAANIGSNTEALIRLIIASKTHPEQAYKSCLGILTQDKKRGKGILELACGRALLFGSYNYMTVKNILEKHLYKLNDDEQLQYKLPEHDNIRGSEYYSNNQLSNFRSI